MNGSILEVEAHRYKKERERERKRDRERERVRERERERERYMESFIEYSVTTSLKLAILCNWLITNIKNHVHLKE